MYTLLRTTTTITIALFVATYFLIGIITVAQFTGAFAVSS